MLLKPALVQNRPRPGYVSIWTRHEMAAHPPPSHPILQPICEMGLAGKGVHGHAGDSKTTRI